MIVPFLDLKAQYQTIKDDIDNALNNVINTTKFIRGEYVENFEETYANMYGVKHFISCANGTDAIYIALKSLDIGVGDEVITVANTWISTAETISQTGAEPIFIDIDPKSYNIDTSIIEEKITKNTKAIIPVHLFGQAVKMDEIRDLCNRYSLFLIEDCAQAHFAQYKGQYVGTFGDSGTFSFYPGKNLGAYGDAGGIITNNDEYASRMRMFANHGSLVKHEHQILGINSRMDGIQAAILNVKLKHIKNWTKSRINNASYYNKILANIEGVKLPIVLDNSTHVYHLYVIRVENRKKIQNFLKENGISTGIHYPKPLPYLNTFKYKNHTPKDFPVVWDYKDKILSLPMYPELTSKMMDYVSEKIFESQKI